MLEKTEMILPILALASGYGADLLFGDPRWLPHPVRGIGRVIASLESFLRVVVKSSRGEKLAGTVMVILVSGGAFLATVLVLKLATGLHRAAGFLLSAYLYYAMIAVRDMVSHVDDIRLSLEEGELKQARDKVGYIVSRDTGNLSGPEVSRASLESLFENTADGVVAPLLYAALGGPALMVFFKAVSTLDSMIGYKNSHYLHFGWAAARLDDLLSYFPARLCALAFLLVGKMQGQLPEKTWQLVCREGKKHESPNSAWPEAAAAVVMRIRLGGTDLHKGKQIHRPLLNGEGEEPRPEHLKPAMRLFYRTTIVTFAGVLVLALIVRFVFSSYFPEAGVYW